ncbi:MAG TPA: hypothetical protein DCO77_04090 [Nitrospiraceae bacterium]|nr:hypothetical protein [Nitrospiraceae bacterium]
MVTSYELQVACADEEIMTKMKGNYLNLLICGCIGMLILLVPTSLVLAETIDDIRVLKISPQDQRAAVKLSDGEMVIIKVGSVLRVAGDGLRVVSEQKKKKRVAGYEVRVKDIAAGRVVFEERKDRKSLPERVVIRVAGSGKQRVERLKKVKKKQPTMQSVRQKNTNTKKK